MTLIKSFFFSIYRKTKNTIRNQTFVVYTYMSIEHMHLLDDDLLYIVFSSSIDADEHYIFMLIKIFSHKLHIAVLEEYEENI